MFILHKKHYIRNKLISSWFCVRDEDKKVHFSVVFDLFNAVYVIFCKFLQLPEIDVKQFGVAARG